MATLKKRTDRAKRLNSVDDNQYTDTVAIEDANVIIHQIEDYITSAIGEGFFWDILTVETTVLGQSEYSIPVLSVGDFNGTPKIEGISIQYKDGGDFVPATEKNRQILLQEHDLSWYETNISEANPIYFIADNSYFIYPAPLVAVADSIKLYGIKSLADILITTEETSIFGGKIPIKYFYMISEGMGQFIKRAEKNETEAQNAKNQFELVTLPSLVEKLGNRKVGISQRGTPNLSKYK